MKTSDENEGKTPVLDTECHCSMTGKHTLSGHGTSGEWDAKFYWVKAESSDACNAHDPNTCVANQDYLEVLVDIAINAGNMIATDQIQILDSRSVPLIVKALADAFTEKHKGEDWIETDYIQTIDAFADEELKKAYPLPESSDPRDETSEINQEYLEVLVDIAINAGNMIATNQIQIIDSRSIPATVKTLADAFTQKYKDKNWDDGDYIETVDAFADEGLKDAYPLTDAGPDKDRQLAGNDGNDRDHIPLELEDDNGCLVYPELPATTKADADERYEEGLWLSCGYCGESNHSFNLKVHAPKVAVECDSCGAISPPANTRYEALALHNDRADVWMPEPEELARRIADQRAGGIGKQ